MAYVVDVYEPWLGEGYSTYDAEQIAELEGVSLKDWLQALREATQTRGGRVIYEGDPDERPQQVKEELEKMEGSRSAEPDSKL